MELLLILAIVIGFLATSVLVGALTVDLKPRDSFEYSLSLLVRLFIALPCAVAILACTVISIIAYTHL